MIQFDEHIFQMGWSHQPEILHIIGSKWEEEMGEKKQKTIRCRFFDVSFCLGGECYWEAKGWSFAANQPTPLITYPSEIRV